MKWFDKTSNIEDIVREVSRKFGMVKRVSSVSIVPETPMKRPFSIAELKVLKSNFGETYTWSDIDASGRVILFDKSDNHNRSIYYVTEEDIKKQIEYQKLK